MSVNVDNLVLGQLPLVRSGMKRVEVKLSDRVDRLETKVDGNTGVLAALGRYLHDIDHRIEPIEAKLGIDQ